MFVVYDSGVVAKLLSELTPREFWAFTISFTDGTRSELVARFRREGTKK